MRRVIETVRNKMRIKLIETGFCLGIGMDQITPEYHIVVFTHFMGYVSDTIRPVDTVSIHAKSVNTDSKYKPNYGKRVRFKK